MSTFTGKSCQKNAYVRDKQLLLDPIRHLGYRSSEELKRIERNLGLENSPPLILFPSRRKSGGIEIYCGNNWLLKSNFKELLGDIDCFDSNVPRLMDGDITKLFNDSLIIEGSAYIVGEEREGRKHKIVRTRIELFDKDYLGCRPRGSNFEAPYMGNVARTISGHFCAHWSQVNLHHFNDANFPGEGLQGAYNLCRNPDKSPCGPWCYYKADDSFRREPCFYTCAQPKGAKRLRCRPGPVLQWSDQSIFELEKYETTRSGRKCAEVTKDSQNYLNDSEYGCTAHKETGYIGPTCVTKKGNELVKEPCFYACEHLTLICIDRNHMLNIEYNGQRNYSVNGNPCLQWNEVVQYAKDGYFNYQWRWILTKEPTDTPAGPGEFSSEIPLLFRTPMDHNQCLNVLTLLNGRTNYHQYPGLDPVVLKGPICFVNLNGFIVPEPCFKTCEDYTIEANNCIEKSKIRTAVYTGLRNVTVTGKPCLRWDSKPLRWHFPWQLTGPLHNYCRNYGDYEFGPWCYVNNDTVFREPCFATCEGQAKRVVSESSFNWRFSPCVQNPECCERESAEIQSFSVDDDVLYELDQIWPNPINKIKDVMKVEEKFDIRIIIFGIYAAVHICLCICSLWLIELSPDPEKEREKMAMEEEKKYLEAMKEVLAKRPQKQRAPRKSSARTSGSIMLESQKLFRRLRHSSGGIQKGDKANLQ
uniref:Kringle domain-containing protein n=1 Tax=Trichuris muris TaxID=70415 RepID=A0A5S6QXG1_TRIMR